MNEQLITEKYLRRHQNEIFVFGENLEREGYLGSAGLRDLPNTYWFITKKYPDSRYKSHYKVEEYETVYAQEIKKFNEFIKINKEKIFIISKIGSELANRHKIFENVIEPNIKKDLADLKNVKFLW
jgi:hypothetical protein